MAWAATKQKGEPFPTPFLNIESSLGALPILMRFWTGKETFPMMCGSSTCVDFKLIHRRSRIIFSTIIGGSQLKPSSRVAAIRINLATTEGAGSCYLTITVCGRHAGGLGIQDYRLSASVTLIHYDPNPCRSIKAATLSLIHHVHFHRFVGSSLSSTRIVSSKMNNVGSQINHSSTTPKPLKSVKTALFFPALVRVTPNHTL